MMLPEAVKESLIAEVALTRVRVIEALSEACVEASRDKPDADVIIARVLDAIRALDRGESFAEVLDLAKEVELS